MRRALARVVKSLSAFIALKDMHLPCTHWEPTGLPIRLSKVPAGPSVRGWHCKPAQLGSGHSQTRKCVRFELRYCGDASVLAASCPHHEAMPAGTNAWSPLGHSTRQETLSLLQARQLPTACKLVHACTSQRPPPAAP